MLQEQRFLLAEHMLSLLKSRSELNVSLFKNLSSFTLLYSDTSGFSGYDCTSYFQPFYPIQPAILQFCKFYVNKGKICILFINWVKNMHFPPFFIPF